MSWKPESPKLCYWAAGKIKILSALCPVINFGRQGGQATNDFIVPSNTSSDVRVFVPPPHLMVVVIGNHYQLYYGALQGC